LEGNNIDGGGIFIGAVFVLLFYLCLDNLKVFSCHDFISSQIRDSRRRKEI
jgi:hypothetical protein